MSEFKSGQENINLNGRPRGVKNKKTDQWNLLGKYLTEAGAKRFIKAMHKLPDEEYVKVYTRILSYFKPQMRQIDATMGGTGRPLLIGFTDNIPEAEIIEDDNDNDSSGAGDS